MFCTKCGKKNDDHAKFCECCGARLEPVTGQRGAQKEPYAEKMDDRTVQGRRPGPDSWEEPAGMPGRPPKKSNQIVMVVCIVAAVAVVGVGAGFGIHFLMNRQDGAQGAGRLDQEQMEAGNIREDSLDDWSSTDSDSSDSWDGIHSGSGEDADSEDGSQSSSGKPETTAKPTPTATPEPTPTITVTAEPTPEVKKEHRYEFVISDESWGEAYQSCIAKGGYLARFETLEEYEKVTDQLEAQGLGEHIFYIGASRSGQDSTYYWVDSNMNFLTDSPINSPSSPLNGKWLSGEPSYQDGEYQELFLTIYHHSDMNDWVLNDVPNDVVGIWSYYSGKMGYICEYES